MDKKIEFNEALSALIEYATVNANVITKDDVSEYFKNILDSEDMYTAVYKYLAESNIKVEGYTPSNDAKVSDTDTDETFSTDDTPSAMLDKVTDSDEEKMFLDMYYEDLAAIPLPLDAHLISLAERVIAGDKLAVNALVEANLSRVITIADEYTGKGMRKADIISEGNLGLLLAVSSMTEVPDNMDEFFDTAIRKAINSAIDVEVSSLRISNHLSERANAVNDATTHLAEKLGREATIDELCEYLSLPEEKVREILKMSLDAVNNAVTE